MDHKELNFDAGIARSAITWPDGFLISAQASLDVGIEGCDVQARVQKPDGTSEVVELQDEGAISDPSRGHYSVLFSNFTANDGIYTFLVRARCEQAALTPAVPTFERTLRFSGIVIGVSVPALSSATNFLLMPQPATVGDEGKCLGSHEHRVQGLELIEELAPLLGLEAGLLEHEIDALGDGICALVEGLVALAFDCN